MQTADHKKQAIVEAALRRFSHFGINKTTMAEIAQDVAVSKANLYYYFPDKTALVIAVIKHLIEEAYTQFHQVLLSEDSTLKRLDHILALRKQYFEKHYLLHVTLGIADSHLNMEQLVELGQYAEDRELKMLSVLFEKGILQQELVTFDINKTSHLYYMVLKGIAMVHFSKEPNKDIPDISIFQDIYERQRDATILILNGLRLTNSA